MCREVVFTEGTKIKKSELTVRNCIHSNKEIEALNVVIVHLKKVLDNTRIKAILYNEIICVIEHFNIRIRKTSAK